MFQTVEGGEQNLGSFIHSGHTRCGCSQALDRAVPTVRAPLCRCCLPSPAPCWPRLVLPVLPGPCPPRPVGVSVRPGALPKDAPGGIPVNPPATSAPGTQVPARRTEHHLVHIQRATSPPARASVHGASPKQAEDAENKPKFPVPDLAQVV